MKLICDSTLLCELCCAIFMELIVIISTKHCMNKMAFLHVVVCGIKVEMHQYVLRDTLWLEPFLAMFRSN